MPTRPRSLEAYHAKRDFGATPEPGAAAGKPGRAAIFVVQKHDASRLHWDFRLEHDGVLWSWAVPKGPSMDTADKRLAVHVEDHPLDYAGFEGVIPKGNYGAGTVEIWDRGQWTPLGDPADGMQKGEIKFELAGERLSGRFVLVRMKPRPKEKAENWLLIKEHDEAVRPGADAATLEKAQPPARKPARAATRKARPSAPEGAVKAVMPRDPKPQLATLAEEITTEEGWLSEVKFDGYRVLVQIRDGAVTMITRQGHDWTHRMTDIAAQVEKQRLPDALIDAELVALRADGVSDFAALQKALSEGKATALRLYAFDLLYLDGYDLRPCRLLDRKEALAGLVKWNDRLRYSDHQLGHTAAMRRSACGMGLEGIIVKQADAPYRAGRSRNWLKLKCQGREEFVVLGWLPPEGSREGVGSLHLGFYAPDGQLHYIGGVGTGFSTRELRMLRQRLDGLAAAAPPAMLYAGDAPDAAMQWVRPELVVEVQFIGWSGAARLRHAVYLGLREDKPAEEVVRDIPDPDLSRQSFKSRRRLLTVIQAGKPATGRKSGVVVANKPEHGVETLAGTRLTHPDRELWPGITKHDLAEYWLAIAPIALPGIAHRPLALVRAPDGIDGQSFFQKHATRGQPEALKGATSKGDPYLSLDDEAGLVACAQIAAIELHSWGATVEDPDHADRIVLDLDPGEGTGFDQVVEGALLLRDRLKALGLASFCRTTGGKGLHVVVPLDGSQGWDVVKPWCRAFAETLVAEFPDRYLATVSKAARRGKILVDWLRNGRGATAVASYSPRARPGATVAVPLSWKEVTPSLDPQAFTLRSVPDRLKRQRTDPWKGFGALHQSLPIQKPRKR